MEPIVFTAIFLGVPLAVLLIGAATVVAIVKAVVSAVK